MKRIAWLTAVLIVVSSPLWAQTAKPAAKEAAKAAPIKTSEAKPARKSRSNEDARHCLEQPTNEAIIRCAEQYL